MNDAFEMDLKARLEYLEEANFFKMMALDLTKELGRFNSSINQLEGVDEILENTQARATQILGFSQTAFYLVNEADSDFSLARSFPETLGAQMEKEIEALVEDGTFSRAVRDKVPVTAYTEDGSRQLLLHVLATASRVRGMFVGVLMKKARHVREASFELFAILMAHCANALESYELYARLRESNQALEVQVEALSRSEDRLKASEEKYRLLAEAAPEIILLVSPTGTIDYANASAVDSLGYSPGEIIGLALSTVLVGVTDRAGQDLLARNRSKRMSMTAKTGLEIPVEVTMAPLDGGEHQEGTCLFICRDISWRLEQEAERRDLEARLWQTQKMESIGLLASGIAHDFNNLLSVIVNYTTLSMAEAGGDHPAHAMLEKVMTASNRAIQLARNLYTIGREDDHTRSQVNVTAVIRETLGLVKSSLGKALVLEDDLGDGPLMAEAEETRVQQVVLNLVANAGQAMGDGKGTLTVSAEPVCLASDTASLYTRIQPGNYIKITVSDTGPGIEAEALPRLFEPYFSTKTGKANAGLGLAVVLGIVKNFKGGIDVVSTPGSGTAFQVFLPVPH